MVQDLANAYANGSITRSDALTRIVEAIKTEPPTEPGPEWDDFRIRLGVDGLHYALYKGWLDDDFVDDVVDALTT